MKPERSIRLSQGITTFGVGAIVGIGEESFINMDSFRWIASEEQRVTIKLPRLARRLRVKEFKHPRPKEYNKRGAKFNFLRFPRMMFCPSCRAMVEIKKEMAESLNGEIPVCVNHSCRGFQKKQLLPMRFITVCPNGHIDDFPWWRWAHSKMDRAEGGNCQRYDSLVFETISGAGASYATLRIRCKACGAKRDLGGLEQPDALKGIGLKCRGKQPWQSPNTADECDETPQMKQRNASNIYQPVVVSAIDIPIVNGEVGGEPDSFIQEIESHPYFGPCKSAFESTGGRNPGADVLMNMICESIGCTEDVVLSILAGEVVEIEQDMQVKSPYDIRQEIQMEEWPVFFQDINSKKFINVPERLRANADNPVEQSLDRLISHVSLVKKLKEVRALKGFNRLQFDPGKIISPTLNKPTTWLPAIEVYGEGIFISIDQDALDEWYKTHEVKIGKRISSVSRRYEVNDLEERSGPFSAKFIMLHTLSHLLIRQLAFESGYNSSSLRENIYFSDDSTTPMAGILIYTADSDSEGSLGGLVRQGESDRLLPTIVTALQRASWCSADPVCKESDGQGELGLNQAACHACSLISETSCTYFNTLLNRTLLIDEEIGFFKDVYKAIEVAG